MCIFYKKLDNFWFLGFFVRFGKVVLRLESTTNQTTWRHFQMLNSGESIRVQVQNLVAIGRKC